ncbi:MAG: CoA-transferase [Thermodesulfobacteriota bacterium]
MSKPAAALACSLDELMITALAREVRDDTYSAVGTLSPLPAAGCLLASLTSAPQVKMIMLGDPEAPLDRGSSQLFDMAQRGLIDLFFLSFVQMDAEANLNLIALGQHDRPKVRFPGGAGSSMLYHMVSRVVLFKTSHTVRDFVPRVDFVTCSGYHAPLDSWQRPGGPSKVVTPLAVLRVEREPPRIVLESVHPGVTPEQVQENTGFALDIPARTPQTPPPSVQELEMLRSQVLPRLARIYPAYAQRWRERLEDPRA